MPKTKEKEKKQHDSLTWEEAWCLLSLQSLREMRGWVIALHPVHGIVNAARNEHALRDRLNFYTKKKIACDVVVLDVDSVLLKHDTKVTPAALPELKPLTASLVVDPIKNLQGEGLAPTKFEPLSINSYAQQRGYRLTEVLVKLISMGKEGAHVSSLLDEETVKLLDEVLPKKDPFTSPHKQPAYQPRKTNDFDHNVLVDGGGAAWRSRQRID